MTTAFAPNRCRPRGFSLIELMVTLAMLAIALLLAAPSLSDAIQNARASSVLRRFPQDMAWARNRAATSSEGVKVVVNGDCTWSTQVRIPGSTNTMTWTEQSNHSMTDALPLKECSVKDFAAGVTIEFNSRGLISNGAAPQIIATGKSGNVWTMQVLLSGLVLMNVKTSS